jgi:23S rRNA (cytidine2498-2'-O)-methyltransferase
VIAYYAAENFEAELLEELGAPPVARYGRLFFSSDESPRELVWAQNTWLNAQEIEISSITDAAKKLRSLKAQAWALTPIDFHRRASLIQEQLPKLKAPAVDFLDKRPDRVLGSWGLVEQNKLVAATECVSRFPNGEVHFNENKLAPSRAYLKLWELFTVYGVRPEAGERCIDLGASPGGWTWVLANLGCEVIAVDRAPLAESVAKLKGVTFRKGNAFTLKPSDIGAVDWVFSDVICYPKDLADLIDVWRNSGLAKNFVCTIKFQGKTDFGVTSRLANLPGAKIKHLYNNKHEVTCYLLQKQCVQS